MPNFDLDWIKSNKTRRRRKWHSDVKITQEEIERAKEEYFKNGGKITTIVINPEDFSDEFIYPVNEVDNFLMGL